MLWFIVRKFHIMRFLHYTVRNFFQSQNHLKLSSSFMQATPRLFHSKLTRPLQQSVHHVRSQMTTPDSASRRGYAKSVRSQGFGAQTAYHSSRASVL